MSESSREEIIDAALIDDEDDPQRTDLNQKQNVVRQGSPFAKDPPQVRQRARTHAERSRPFEAGLWTVTAGGAVLASALLVPMGLASFWVFPGGAVAVALLGGLMSLMGLNSFYPRWSFALLIAHIAVFLLAEVRLWT